MKSDSPNRSILRFFPAPHPVSATLVLLAASLLCVTAMFMRFDVVSCWLEWSFASKGVSPSRIYLTRPDCNYPPLMLYLLTAQEALRRALGWAPGPVLLYMVKVPQILSHVAGAIIAYFGTRRLFGEKYARQVCFAYALSAALFVNAALWGQADAMLSLAMVATILLLMNDKPIPAGIVFGLALCIKLQAIIIAPVVLLYAFRKYGWKQSVLAIGAGAAVIALLALPVVLGGAGQPWLKSYVASAGYYPYRTLNAFNLWAVTDWIARTLFHLDPHGTFRDDSVLIGSITSRHIGLILFAVALVALLYKLYRTPTARTLTWTAALSAFSFFVLCTQMHERYGVPAAALFTLVAPESAFALFVCFAVNICAGWNQWLILLMNWSADFVLSPAQRFQIKYFDVTLLGVSLANCGLLIVGLWHGLRSPRPAEEPVTCPPSAE